MTTRRKFLSDTRHRIRFVYLPKHSSRLNQIEIFFGILQRKCLRGGNFTSVFELESQLRQFIIYYNTTGPIPANLCKKTAGLTSSRATAASKCENNTNHQALPPDETSFPSCGPSSARMSGFLTERNRPLSRPAIHWFWAAGKPRRPSGAGSPGANAPDGRFFSTARSWARM